MLNLSKIISPLSRNNILLLLVGQEQDWEHWSSRSFSSSFSVCENLEMDLSSWNDKYLFFFYIFSNFIFQEVVN